MSEKGAEGILRRRAEERAAAEAASRPTYVIENPERPAPSGESRTSRAFGAIHEHQRTANYRTGLSDPRLATWLYLAVVATAIMFTQKWGEVVAVVASSTKSAAQAKK